MRIVGPSVLVAATVLAGAVAVTAPAHASVPASTTSPSGTVSTGAGGAPYSAVTLAPAATTFDPDPWQPQVVSTPDGGSLAVWGRDTRISARTWDPRRGTWGTPLTVADNAAVSVHFVGSQPAVAASATGEDSVAWVADPSTANERIQVSTITTTDRTPSFTPARDITPAGTGAGEVRLAYGTDGTLAATWVGAGGAISVVVRSPSGVWGPPTTVSPTISSDASPQVDQPNVAITGKGAVVACWYADDPAPDADSDSPSPRRYRAQCVTRPAGGAWTTATWATDLDGAAAGDAPTSSPAAPPSMSGAADAVAVAWNRYAVVESSAGWHDAVRTPTVAVNDLTVSVDATGGFTTAWEYYSGTSDVTVTSRRYRPATGWDAPIDVATGQAVYDLQLASGLSGPQTIVWMRYVDNGFVLEKASRATPSAAWTTPVRAVDEPNVRGFSAATDAAGFLVVVYNREDPDGAQRTHGEYSLHAVAQQWPALRSVTAPTVTGLAQAGHALTVSTGSWTPAPTTTTRLWQRRSPTTIVLGPVVALGRDDAGAQYDPVVRVDAPFHLTTTWIGTTITVASLATTITAAGPPRVAVGARVLLSASLSTAYGRVYGAPYTLELWTRPVAGGAWTRVATRPLTAGLVRLYMTPQTGLLYQWRHPGVGADVSSYATAASRTTVRRVGLVPSVTARTTATRRAAGRPVVLWGTTNPASRQVTVQEQSGRTWRSVAQVACRTQVLPDGRRAPGYSWSFTRPRAGVHHFRVVRLAVGGLDAGYSATATVRFTR